MKAVCFAFVTLLITALVPAHAQPSDTQWVSLTDNVAPNGAYWTSDGTAVVVVGADTVQALAVPSGRLLASTTEPLLVDYPLTYQNVTQPLAWTRDGAYAAVVDDERRSILVYERGNADPINRIEAGNSRRFNGLVWHPTEPFLIPEYSGFVNRLSILRR